MANFNRTLTINTSGTGSVTQNVVVNDTITVTVQSGGSFTGTASITNNSSSVCSISASSVSIGSSFTITATATGTIDVLVVLFIDKSTSESGTVGGTVSAGNPIAPTVSATQTASGTGYQINANPTGTTNGTIEYQFSGQGLSPNTRSFTSSYQTGSTFTVGGEWGRSTWTVTARATDNGVTATNSDSVTLPTTPPYTAGISVTPTNRDVTDATSSTTFTVDVTNEYMEQFTQYRLGSSLGSARTGEGVITANSTDSGWPSTGQTTNFTVQAALPAADGGDGAWDNTSATGSITNIDSTPNQFSFNDVTGVALSSTQTSNQVTIGGINTSVAVSVSGGTYSKNSGAYTSSAGTAVNGDTFTVRHTSAGTFSTAVNTTLTVGGVSDTFTSATLAEDTTPNSFTFTDQTNVQLNTTQTSNLITISGINSTASVSITGGTYSKNGGAYTSASGTATNGDTFRVRHTSSSNFSSSVNTTLTVGGVSDTFTTTTGAADSTPNSFTFNDQTNVQLNTTQTSNEITISGINTSVSVSVSGGTYSKNGGAYTSASGTAVNGDTFRVRHTSSSSFSSSVNTSLTVGGVSDTFTTTTGAQDTTPDQFNFTDVNNVARSTTQTSNLITLSGMNSPATVTVSGGTYSKNGGAYTSSSTTGSNGDTFRVRHTSSANFGTAVNTTLNVGSVSDTFTSTTLAQDVTPDAFSFTDVNNVSTSTTQTSNQITISGINDTVSVSITGGTYSKNSGAYTSSAGTAINGDTFTVRHTSSASFNTAVNTTLTVGGVSDTYTSTTTTGAPIISSITNDNAAATSVTSTVNLSSTGEGGTLEYAQTTTTSVPATGWQTSNQFSQDRGTSRYYWASRDRDTAARFDGPEIQTVGYIAPDTTITSIPSATIPNTNTSFDITIANGGSNDVYEVRTTSYTGTVVGSRTGNGTLTVSDAPADDSQKTYYLTVRKPLAVGGEDTTSNIQTFVVTATNAIPTTNVTLDDIHVIVGGTTQTLVTIDDSDVRGIGTPDPTYAPSGINQTSGTEISMGLFRGATADSAVEFVGAAGYSGVSSVTNISTAISGITTGDLLLVYTSDDNQGQRINNGTTYTWDIIEGTALASSVEAASTASVDFTTTTVIYNSEIQTNGISLNTAVDAVIIAAFRNTGTVSSSTNSQASGTTMTPGSTTVGADGSVVVLVVSIDDDSSTLVSPPSGYTIAAQNGRVGGSAAICYKLDVATGTESPGSLSWSSPDSLRSGTFHIQPA